MRKQWSFRALAVLLVVSLLVTLGNRGLLSPGENTVSVKASGDAATEGIGDYITYNGSVDLSTLGNAPDAPGDEEAPEQTPPEDKLSEDTPSAEEEAAARLYSDGKIHIFNFRQLRLVGTGELLTTEDAKEETVGTGAVVTDENGSPVTYSSKADYYLECDFALPEGAEWQLPADFAGEFTSAERMGETTPEPVGDGTEENGDRPGDEQSPGEGAKNQRLYDVESDTIFIQNIYQLKTLADYDRATIPVMTGDWSAEKFGIGQMIYPDGETGGCLTYSPRHHYVISSEFSAAQPEEVSIALRGAEMLRSFANPDISHVDGRDYFGQVAVSIAGVDYILIGDRQQLEAINYGRTDALGQRTDIEVFGPVYKVHQHREYSDNLENIFTEWETVSVELHYPGDADLIDGVNVDGTNHNFGSNVLFYGNNELIPTTKPYHQLYDDPGAAGLRDRTIYCTVDPVTGELNTASPANNTVSLNYTRSGNYIVFRDIDMNNSSWTPMMFNGNMIGTKAPAGGKLWNKNRTLINVRTDLKPHINKFRVVPATKDSGKLDVLTNVGVGFFGTLGTQHDGTNPLGDFSQIKNIALSNGSVVNNCTECYVDRTLVTSLLVGLGDFLGRVLDPALNTALGRTDIQLQSSLTDLLNARATDPSSLATGAFAGRVMGEVDIADCLVENVSVTTVRTSFEENKKIVGKGGFVGYVEGEFQYDALSEALSTVTNDLAYVLNLLPGVGLGDLVDILLDNTLATGKLVPTGYSRPTFEDCAVSGCTLSHEAGKYGVGGFAGSIGGAFINDSVVRNSTFTVKAERFGGGFVGVERDEIIRAALSGLKIIVGKVYPQSEIVDCTLQNCELTVSGGDCLGGLVGIQANSYVIACDIDENSTVTIDAEGDCIGGVTGSAQLGSSFCLTKYLPLHTDLLSLVSGVLTQALEDNDSGVLLALGGVSPSAILGCRIDCPLSVKTNGCKVGGILGFGEGTVISDSSVENVSSLNLYADGNNPIPKYIREHGARRNQISQLVRVSAEKKSGGDSDYSYVGGGVGYLESANTGSLLGDTLGLKSYLGFRLEDTTITGVSNGCTVHADGDYAGGVIGLAIGGDVDDVQLFNLLSVTANNHVGGFVGTTGPDTVVGGNGLDLNLLGLDVLRIDNLLGLTGGIHTDYNNCHVTGVLAGFTVKADGTRDTDNPLDLTDFSAGGFAGDVTSAKLTNCTVSLLTSVKADDRFGMAGGFVGRSAAGDLSGISTQKEKPDTIIGIGQLAQFGADLIPSFDACEVTFADAGFVQANAAGGFAGVLCSGDVNQQITAPQNGKGYAVHNIDHVLGGEFAGGFGGKVYSGALMRDGGSTLSLLGGLTTVDVGGLESLTTQYIPKISYAGVDAENGFTVLAAYIDDPEDTLSPSAKGYAGGYIGYGSGMKVSNCDVKSLKKRTPQTPANLEVKDGGAYLSFTPGWATVPYSVAGATYAGGYIGYMNVGCAKALGDSIKLLDQSLRTAGLLKGLDIVLSTIEHSDVYGKPGGYSVLASSHVNLGDGQYDEKGVGFAGGYVARMGGAHIQDSNANNFSYIIGEIASGGYAGEMHPGDVADVLDYEADGGTIESVLGGVIETDDLVAVIQAFVPTIFNSRTTCIPCGGAVRAQSFSDSADEMLAVRRGFAGGYLGHGVGAQIWGQSSTEWLGENEYSGPKRDCDALRIRSVYGAEYAGGYVGLMESGSTAQTGDLTLLSGLLTANNLVGALEVVYPTIEHANVYGPLEQLDPDTWNAWSEYVGQNGGFASELSQIGRLTSQAQVDEVLSQFIYGYHVVAGRDGYVSNENTRLTGCAGGFAGAMHSGVVRYGTANNAKLVRAMRSAGGFAGEILTRGIVEFGSVDLFGSQISLDVGDLLNLTSVFVPVVYESGVTGYQNGLIVRAEGDPTDLNSDGKLSDVDCGMAGGFVGDCQGGQIGNRADGKVDNSTQIPTNGAWVRNLKTVTGKNCIGGFAGKTSSPGVADADDSEVASRYIQKLLDSLVSNPADLVRALDATVTVVGKAEVSGIPGTDWGIVIDGEYTDDDGSTKYAPCAGGFVGSAEASVFGARNTPARTLTVTGLRGVSGGLYAGGFFGLASVGDVADVGSGGEETSVLLNLIQAGNTSVLDVFRTYIYHATVNCKWVSGDDPEAEPQLVEDGPEDGVRILSHDKTSSGIMHTHSETGCAGGFGGALMNGTVENSYMRLLNCAQAKNYAGGFIGLLGTDSGVNVKDVKVDADAPQGEGQGDDTIRWHGLDLTANPQLLNVIGSTVVNCHVRGFVNGFITRTTNIQETENTASGGDVKGSCAAGFAGYADMSQLKDCSATGFKYAKGPQIAGGFVGRSAMNYLVDVQLDSNLTELVVKVVDVLVKALYIDHAEGLNLVDYDSDLAGLKIMSDGDLLYVNLLGLKISASLSKDDPEYGGQSDAAIVTIGSSTVKLPCSQEGVDWDNENCPDIEVTLIEGNRTNIENCSVKGVPEGYDVFAGGADEYNDGTDDLGYAGGFIGYNDAGLITQSSTELCDVIRGTDDKVGPFTGYSDPRSKSVGFLEADGDLAGNNCSYTNTFSIYRTDNGGYTRAEKAEAPTLIGNAEQDTVAIRGESCNRYVANHYQAVKTHGDFENAVETGGTSENRALLAYVSPAMEVLMLNIPLDDNGMGDSPITTDLKDPCDTDIDLTVVKVWKDFIYLDSRPDSIRIKVAQVESGEVPPDEMIISGSTEGLSGVRELILDNAGGSAWLSTWQATLNDLPVAVRRTVDGQEKVFYYQYVVEEVGFEHYRASYDVDQDSATARIINRYTGPLLPSTGGEGVMMFYAVGMFLLISGGMLLILRFSKSKNNKPAAASPEGGTELDISNFSDFFKDLRKKKK